MALLNNEFLEVALLFLGHASHYWLMHNPPDQVVGPLNWLSWI